jgi:hypothetical protein
MGRCIKLHEFYSSTIIIMMIKMGGACSTNIEKRNAFRLLAGKRPIGRPRCRCVDNIEIGLGEIGWGGVDWIGLAQDRDK